MPGIADRIPQLARLLDGTDIELLELTAGTELVRLRRNIPGPGPAPCAPAGAGAVPFDIPAPSVGVFRRGHPLRTAPLVQAGQSVAAGDPVGVLQIGALLIHAVAPKDGTVLEVLAEDGAAVGYGTALVRFVESGEQ